MKKTLIASLISVAVIATMITAAACAAKKSATVKAAAPAIQETAAEATEEIINDGQNPVMNFIGNYYNERVCINVEAEGANGAKITVTWGSSYDTKAVWTMSGIFSEETTSVSYENGIKKYVTYNELGEIISEEVLSTACKGIFVFSYDGVTWMEQNEHIADNMVFRFNGSVEDLVEDADAVVFPVETVTIKNDKPTEKPAEPEVKPAEPEETEPSSEIPEPAHKTAAEISGTYACGRATATVDAADPDNVMIKIVWSDSADTKAIWRISGRYDEETETILYEGGVKKILTFDENGDVESEEVDYTDGNGAILFSYDGFTWADYNENVADNLVFIKSV
ncbi:MAG: hypothetical protein K6E72_06550 [Saccharofermentans sp.]|nr:hypothetical protein [Saccharofermentans sp.]